ncbi:hypothetical protein [Ruegeria marina]|uniref:Uncharacterized protein n=1 Tax=Ruegeria marina TaxID=639004 RepID=A0A1G6JXR8_9RHOB|nr:hypothetical protein [Ruegeria marina]SDC23195.1 hypothetical protein SAMN04488239_101459 [Ruegeria marina]
MPTEPHFMRHALLFELLRQQCRSETTARRLTSGADPVTAGDAILLQTRARKSLGRQCLATAQRPITQGPLSAPFRTAQPGPGTVPPT